MQLFNDLTETLKPKFEQNNRVGFFISGGFDSSLLLYASCLIKQQQNLDNQFVSFVVPRHDDSVVHANRILYWISEKFQMEIPKFYVGNPDLHHSEQVKSGIIEAHQKNLVDLFLNGDTSNPEDVPDGPVRLRSNWKYLFQPWYDYTKDYTVRLMLELNCLELITLTHTCTQSKTIRCKKCWQCRERAWAFAKVGIDDHGTM